MQRTNNQSLNDKEIQKASDAIDKAFEGITSENRGEVAVRILSIVRNLNDHIAYKIWKEMKPDQPMGLQKVASKFTSIGKYKFIARFDTFLRASVSHFTPSEDGAERLILKYYNYLLKLKKVVMDRYGITILHNIFKFIENLDSQTRDYYEKVSYQIEHLSKVEYDIVFDNYYIVKNKPFFINGEIYYEITLEPASERSDKFNRITAFTKHEIMSNYCVAINFVDCNIDVFGVVFPIKLISDWKVSIRPCEINNFAELLKIYTNIQRSNTEYKVLMDYLSYELVTLVDIIDYSDQDYYILKKHIESSTKNGHSKIFEILDKCRYFSTNSIQGKNILRYLLNNMNNRIIKDQRPYDPEKSFYGLYINTKCKPFEDHPYAFNPVKHYSNFYDLLECIDPTCREPEILYRHIQKNTSQNNVLYTPIEDLSRFGNIEQIYTLVDEYNASLFSGFKPTAELAIYSKYVYIKGNESKTVDVLKSLLDLTRKESSCPFYYDENDIYELEKLKGNGKLDDPIKKDILLSMLKKSKVHFIYGSAGTGKTTLLNHISTLMFEGNRIFLAKTNPVVQNLRRKVINKKAEDDFVTIDRFNKSSSYRFIDYDLIVVDECSTIKNEEILEILYNNNIGTIVLVGDIYQIESIGFGNWFNISRKIIPEYAIHELTNTFRSDDEQLKKLWNLVRNMNDDNTVLEQTVRNDYSHKIDNNIFIKKSTDEIILCLNYNGLYGLNNINRLLQLNNPNPVVKLGVWEFKIDDPILFNDSDRFKALYNNLKGVIVGIEDNEFNVRFSIKVNIPISKDDAYENGFDIIKSTSDYTIVSFVVDKRAPYSSDEEEKGTSHLLPFQIAYAVSIHKSQGLEYDSVKIVIADESEDKINHNIFYTAITRAREKLTIYWSPEVCNKVLNRIRPNEYNKDYNILLSNNHEINN